MKRLCTHPGQGHALVSYAHEAQDGSLHESPQAPVCQSCANGIARRALRKGYVRSSCVDAIEPSEKGRHGWGFRDITREDLCLTCGLRRGWCVAFDGAYGRAPAAAEACA